METSIMGRTILDFSKGKFTKNKIGKLLRKSEIINYEKISPNKIIQYINIIKIGMYDIKLSVHYDSPESWVKLNQFKDFEITIGDPWAIDLNKDERFKDRAWVKNNFFGKFRIKDLIEAIHYCVRLNTIKAFL